MRLKMSCFFYWDEGWNPDRRLIQAKDTYLKWSNTFITKGSVSGFIRKKILFVVYLILYHSVSLCFHAVFKRLLCPFWSITTETSRSTTRPFCPPPNTGPPNTWPGWRSTTWMVSQMSNFYISSDFCWCSKGFHGSERPISLIVGSFTYAKPNLS